MPPRQKTPAPIDRPLSRAYLRNFAGWSTAYPPGVSEPTSLRQMENVVIHRDGRVGVRPGVRYCTFLGSEGAGTEYEFVGSFESFFLYTGDKALLLAVREIGGDGKVQFRVGQFTGNPMQPLQILPLDAVFILDTPEADLWFSSGTTYVKYLQIDNRILALSDNGEPARIFRVDNDKRAKVVKDVLYPEWSTASKLSVWVPEPSALAGSAGAPPGPETTPSTTSLQSSNAAANVYNFGFFYTFFNEVGESAPSQIRTIRLQRPWSQWSSPLAVWAGPDDGPDPSEWSDQLIVALPLFPLSAFEDPFYDMAALGFHVYMMTWSDQESVPIEAVRVGTRKWEGVPRDPGAILTDYAQNSWVRVTAAREINAVTMPRPEESTRTNYTLAPRAGNGVVAADRIVLVADPVNPGRISWSAGVQGDYFNFSAHRGGGFKTLTSGNLYVPAAVKLWQNPSSADTLTILTLGVDGYSTGYYMAPAQVASQSEAVNVMGFEETTATPGTVSPYGVEVANNALYHPLHDQLMKSTAANYNINHKSMTDVIANQWKQLVSKEKIVSCFYENKLYYLVNNPERELVEGCMGNELWILDLGSEKPTWARWIVSGISLRSIEFDGQVYLAIVQPGGISIFDSAQLVDEQFVGGVLVERNIPWLIETNTQGANRAHDAWANLQQLNVTLGNFRGRLEYGVRGQDLNGKKVLVSKVVRDDNGPGEGIERWDREDYLQIRHMMREWFFFAHSITEDLVEGETLFSTGQINAVGYRYTPISVNVGYEYGSVETFEYGRSDLPLIERTTESGVPIPYIDTTRP